MNVMFLFLKGMVVGGANVVPGVSGATLAVILRIYDKMIESINNLFSDVTKSLKFLAPIVVGMAAGILVAGGAIDFFLTRFSMQTGGFIAGLMAGSLPFIYSQCVLKEGPKTSAGKNFILNRLVSLTGSTGFFFAGGAAAFIILLTLFAPEGGGGGAYAGASWNAAFFAHLFIGGVFAAATMVIPGISGAMVLMLFGLYPIAMHTISNIRHYMTSPGDFELLGAIFAVLVPLGLGMVAGILLGSRLIALLLAKFHSRTYFVILGLVFGTIFVIFNDPATYKSHDEITPWLVVFTVIAFVCGAGVALVLGKRE